MCVRKTKVQLQIKILMSVSFKTLRCSQEVASSRLKSVLPKKPYEEITQAKMESNLCTENMRAKITLTEKWAKLANCRTWWFSA